MPDTSAVHFDVALTNVSIAYRNTGYVAAILAPDVAVRRQSDRYFVYDAGRESIRQAFDGRAPGAEASEVDFALSSDSYFCDDHALESAVPDEERDNADVPLQPEIDRAEFLADKILLNQEVALRNLVLGGGIAQLDQSGTPWNDDATDILAAVESGRQAVLTATQQLPNTLVLPYEVFAAVRHNALVVDRLTYTNSSAPTAEAIAALFDVERVVIARAARNTAMPGQAPSVESVWGANAILAYVPPRIGLKTIAPFATFVWAHATGSSRGWSAQTWREERRKATMVRVQKYYDQKIIAPGAAVVFANTNG